MKKVFVLLLIFFAFPGCDTTDEALLCDTGPVGLKFEVVDKSSGKNLFEDALFHENRLNITNSKGETVKFHFDINRKVVDVLLGWESKSDSYEVTMGDEPEFVIDFTLTKSSSGGCTSTRLTELEMVGATYEIEENSDIVTIFISSEDN